MEFAGILLRGIFLQAATLGLYSFWLMTQTTRYQWENTRIGGTPFVYTGSAEEMLRRSAGAVLGLAVILIFFLSLGSLLFFFLPLFLPLFYVNFYLTRFDARRYQVSCTEFRGVPLRMSGSKWMYLGHAILWDIAMVLTFGLAYAWRVAALERYMMRNTHYGALRGDFLGSGGSLLVKLWPLSFLIPLASSLLTGGFTSGGSTIMMIDPMAKSSSHESVLAAGVAAIVAGMTVVVTERWRLGGIRMGNIALEGRVPISPLVLNLSVFVIAVAGVVDLLFWAKPILLDAAKSEIPAGSFLGRVLDHEFAPDLIYIPGLLIMLALKSFFIDDAIWRAATDTLKVANFAQLELGGTATGAIEAQSTGRHVSWSTN